MFSHFTDIIEYRVKVRPMEALRWPEMEVFWFCDTAKGRVQAELEMERKGGGVMLAQSELQSEI